jgi:hypothetical protein
VQAGVGTVALEEQLVSGIDVGGQDVAVRMWGSVATTSCSGTSQRNTSPPVEQMNASVGTSNPSDLSMFDIHRRNEMGTASRQT